MKKFLIVIVSFIFLLNFVGCNKIKQNSNVGSNNVVTHSDEDNIDFNKYLDKEFKEAMEADYLTNHYTLKESAAMGITKPEPLLDPKDFTLESYTDFIEDAKESLKELEQFKKDSLSEKQYYDYEVYKFYLDNNIKLNSFPMFDNYFSPSKGVQENLLTTFLEFQFRNKSEFEDYLTLLKGTPDYLNSAIELTKAQAKEGYFMTDSAVDQTIEGIDRFISKVEDNELISSFNLSVDNFSGLTQSEKDELKNKNKEIIINEFIPAYSKLKGELNSLKGSRSIDGGIALYKDGKEYYQTLLESKTGTKLSADELFKLNEKYLDKIIDDYVKAYKADPKSFDFDVVKHNQIKNFETEEMLEFIKPYMDNEYPKGPKVNYEISYLDASTANASTLAYYLSPPIDDISNNIIKVNPNTGDDKFTLYTTIAHEGFPGHLYQITYYLDSKPHPLRSSINNITYTEGWAMYTEINSIDYLDITSSEKLVEKLDIRFGYALNSAVDIAVNGLGWSFRKLDKWISKYVDDSYSRILYDSVVDDPSLLIPYGIGLIFMENFRNKAEKELGDKFDVKQFHEIILKNGDRPLFLLELDIDKYISSHK